MSINETGELKFGLKIGENFEKEFELRPIKNVGELFDAELEANPESEPMSYTAAIMARQLVKLGSFTGPFTLGMLRALRPVDFNLLRIAQNKLSKRGDTEGK